MNNPQTTSYDLGDRYEVYFPSRDGQLLRVSVPKDCTEAEYVEALRVAELEVRN